MKDAVDRHQNIAFQFSGGRDSLAALYLLKPYWDRMTVYHMDCGDQFPETQAVVDRVAGDVPRFVRIQGDVHAVIAEYGVPSDLIPASHNTDLAVMTLGTFRIQDRFSCCWRTIMAPMHERMMADGVTLIIRGQRKDDRYKGPLSSGEVLCGIEYLYPVEDWSSDDIDGYLRDNSIEPAPFYAHGVDTTLECMHCSAWWDHPRASYLKRFHPAAFDEYRRRLEVVRSAVTPHMFGLLVEMEN